MATSGTTTYNRTAGQIVTAAFKKLGVQPAEQPLQAFELADGIEALNMMIKAFQVPGLHLWTETEAVLFLNPGQPEYLVGPQGSQACRADDFVPTTTTADAVITQTFLLVQSTVGMTIGDKVGVQLNSGVRQWTTIAGVDSATHLTLAAGLAGAASSGNTVFTFTTLLEWPARVLNARRQLYGQQDEIPLEQWSRQQYFDQPNKTTQGVVSLWYYSPQTLNGQFYVWETTNTVNQYINFTFERVLQDVTAANQTIDFPTQWLECIVYSLALRLLDDYDCPDSKAMRITQRATELQDLLGWDLEMSSVNIQPDNRGL